MESCPQIRTRQVACTLTAADHAARIKWIEELNARRWTATSATASACDSGTIRQSPRGHGSWFVENRSAARSFVSPPQEDQDAFMVIIDAPIELGTAADDLFAPYIRPGGQPDDRNHARERRGCAGSARDGKTDRERLPRCAGACGATLLDRFDRLKVLFLLDEPFGGWSLHAAWVNTVFDVKYRRAL